GAAPQDDESGQVALKPIHVFGAGPSGLAAALAANQAGRRVIVHERCSDVGHRFHDDFQGLENWTTDGDVIDELAGLGIEPTFEHTPIREAVVFDPRRVHRYRSPRPLFYLVRRGARAGTLDSSLKAQALARGIERRFGEGRPLLREGGVVAQGPHGSDAVALGYVFETKAADGAFAAMSDRLAPKGYAYLLVVRGQGTVASCMFDKFHNKQVYLERTVAFFREKVGFDMQNARRFAGAARAATGGSRGYSPAPRIPDRCSAACTGRRCWPGCSTQSPVNRFGGAVVRACGDGSRSGRGEAKFTAAAAETSPVSRRSRPRRSAAPPTAATARPQ